eukprot:2999750-Amphidinium_carterae.3
MSSLAFARLLQYAVKHFHQSIEALGLDLGRGVHVLASDDVILSVDRECVDQVWSLWKDALAKHHLRVKASKTVAYHPDGKGPPEGELLDVSNAQPPIRALSCA